MHDRIGFDPFQEIGKERRWQGRLNGFQSSRRYRCIDRLTVQSADLVSGFDAVTRQGTSNKASRPGNQDRFQNRLVMVFELQMYTAVRVIDPCWISMHSPNDTCLHSREGRHPGTSHSRASRYGDPAYFGCAPATRHEIRENN